MAIKMKNGVLCILILLTVILDIGLAIVCTKNICETVRCMQITTCDEGQKLVKHGGFCKCCDACYAILGEYKTNMFQLFDMFMIINNTTTL